MSIISVFTIPSNDFLLGEVLGEHRDVGVRLEAVVPAGEQPVPYVWLSGGSKSTVERIAADTTVSAATTLDETEDGILFRIDWEESVTGFMQILLDSEGSLLDGTASNGEWTLRARFPDRQALAAFTEECRQREIEPRLERLSNPGVSGGEDLLTERQQETLRMALALGYFEVPREVTLEELAGELDVSDNAISQRLRRGLRCLVESTLEP